MSADVIINLSRGLVTLVDSDDVHLLSAVRWYADIINGKFYAATIDATKPRKDRRPIRMHRFITGAIDGEIVDHINGDTLDNRRENLRLVSALENARNAKVAKNSKTGYKGVHPNSGGTFSVQITANRKVVHVGRFDNVIEAAKAYDKKAIELHGQYAWLNFPNESS